MRVTVYIDHYYDFKRGWEGTNPGWHTAVKYNVKKSVHKEIIMWLYENIDNTERHTRWVKFDDSSQFRFRYERDYILFTLRWL